MKIVARIEKLAGVQFRFDGRVFDSFLDARREMATRAKLRRDERAARASRPSDDAAGLERLQMSTNRGFRSVSRLPG